MIIVVGILDRQISAGPVCKVIQILFIMRNVVQGTS